MSIGVKKLSDADLGKSTTSNQTHIGLYDGVLTFLDDSDVKKECLFIYNSSCKMRDCYFDRIKNPDGTFRSPKIRKGSNGKSIVDDIRIIASTKPEAEWFLMWSCLESEQIVFWLFNNKSKDFQKISHILPKLSMVITGDNPTYKLVKELFLQKINNTSNGIQKDLEVASQTGKNFRLYKRKDIEKADKLFRQIGKEGESLIAEYLDKQKNANHIVSYHWMNANKESGAPFDFIINEGTPYEQFIDVKSTRFDFNQYIYFSNDEVKFINDLSDNLRYSVFRVYDMTKDIQKLSICNNCQKYITNIHTAINHFFNSLAQEQTILQNIKLGINPHHCFNEIQSPINL